MENFSQLYPYQVDLSNCENEPLHHIQAIQGQVGLLACKLSTLEITYASENSINIIGRPARELLGRNLEELLGPEEISIIRMGLNQLSGFEPLNPIRAYFQVNNERVAKYIVAHISGSHLVLEVEPISEFFSTSSFQYRLGLSVSKVQELKDYTELFDMVATETRSLTGYDRVMVYRFDEEYNGEVVAEARSEHVKSFLGLRYPASDIPRQARDLYLKNQVRLIYDVNMLPARLLSAPSSDELLDLSYAGSRAVSPIHIEYLQNMGVRASLSIAIIVSGKLWGLIACHHYSPRYIDYKLRSFVRFIGTIFSGHLALSTAHEYRQRVLNSNLVRSYLYEQMSKDWDVHQGLTHGNYDLLDLITGATGAVIHMDNTTTLYGKTPSAEQVEAILEWLRERPEAVIYYTDNLVDDYPLALDFVDKAAGLLSISLTLPQQDFVLWFKPETLETIHWGGNPAKAILQSPGGHQRLSPRKSFEKWAQQVHQHSTPWTSADIDAALALRNNIKDVILERYRNMQRVNEELRTAYQELESFSYTVSHDLRGPLRGIEGFAQILLEDYGEQLDDYGREVVKTIVASTMRMNDFINDILAYSRLGQTQIRKTKVDLYAIARSEIEALQFILGDREVDFRLDEDLPPAYGDPTLLRMLLNNLLTNAVKYSRNRQPAIIAVGSGQNAQDERYYYVKDNGIGFDMAYADKVFGVFHRLVPDEEYEGTGVGLAIAKKIVEKHEGRIWVESYPEQGTTFYFRVERAKE